MMADLIENANAYFQHIDWIFQENVADPQQILMFLYRLLASSDPYITSIRRQPQKQLLDLDDIVKEMIADE